MTKHSPIVLLYVVFATLALLLVAPTMPPFQNADETNHLLRASQISHGGLLPERLADGQQGGMADAGLLQAVIPFDGLRFHRENKIARTMYPGPNWSTQIPAGFPNTVIYPPVFYFPAAAALWLTRLLGGSVLHGVLAARLATGAASLALGAAAIALADAAAPWLFCLLLLPMTMSLSAAASQDGMLIASTALAAALAHRMAGGRSARCFWPLIALLSLIATARPPYAGFASVILLAPGSLRRRIGGIVVVLLAVVAWSAVVAPHIVAPPPGPGGIVDAAAQLRLLLHAPWRVATLFTATLAARGHDLAIGFIGYPGWLDVDLPPLYHACAWGAVAAAFAFCLSGAATLRMTTAWVLAAAGIAAVVPAIVLLQYLTWTVVGAAVIDGLQGRYFIPPALMLAALLPALRPRRFQPVIWCVMLFPLVSVPVLVRALILRYYF